MQRINIQRSQVFKDAFKQFSKKLFDEKNAKSTFYWRGAVDEGGPRREFFIC